MRWGWLLCCAMLAGCSFVKFGVANAPDAAAPRVATPGRPVVVFWYGGSWVEGNKAEYRFVGITLAGQGFVAVLPDYRLYPQVTFPAFDADGAAAVAWVEKHVREFGGDPGLYFRAGGTRWLTPAVHDTATFIDSLHPTGHCS